MAGNLTAMIAAAFSGGAAPPVTSDPYFEYTTLLLPGNGTNGAQNNTFLDGSTNNFTITRNGNTTQGTFSPFSQTGWGNYFDGTNDYLSYASTTTLNFGTSDFTVECWINIGNTTGSKVILTGTSANSFGFRYGTAFNTNNGLSIFRDQVADLENCSFTFAVNTWYHVAVVRQSNVIKFFVDGEQKTTSGSGGASYNFPTESNVRVGAGSGGGEPFGGYISNLRVVKGTAVYTGNFTPSTTPLTAVSGTSLLTCQSNRFIDNSSNNFTITANNGPLVVAFSPFNPSASWSAATYGGSGYFDGSGDYLSAASNALLSPGSGDFTMEAWIYPAVSYSAFNAIYVGTAGTGWFFGKVTSGIGLRQIGVSDLISATPPAINQWVHVAVTRSGTDLRLFFNGVQQGATVTNSTNFSTSSVYVGDDGASGAPWNGYISSFRFVKGTAVYTSNFTPPTAPLTAITNTSLLLNFTNAGIYDATSKNDLETVGNAQISTAQFKFSPSSIAFDGTGDYLDLSPSGFSSFGTGNFTVEFWMRTAGSSFNIINPATATGTGYWALLVNTGSGGFRWNDAYNSTNLWTQTATSVLDNNWHHIAVVRNGTGSGNVNIYFDGVAQGTAKTDSTNYNGASTAWRIGSGNVGALNGYIQDLRITPGIARYTANFTAPTAAFPTL